MTTLINKKTGKEFKTSDPEKVLKRFPKTFRVKPLATLNKDVAQKDQEVAKSTEKTDVENASKKITTDKPNTPKKEK